MYPIPINKHFLHVYIIFFCWMPLFNYCRLILHLRSKKSGNEVKKKGGGFCKLCRLSPLLQEFVGAPEMARTEVYLEFLIIMSCV